VVTRFKPDLVVIAVDPHGYPVIPVKPSLVQWLKQQTNCFEEVFSDDTASGFKVRAGSGSILEPLVPRDYVLREGG
jgi:hypothetical protein